MIQNDIERFPAEWEVCDGVLLAWPHKDTDWAYMLDEVHACYARIIGACAARGKVIIVGPECPDKKYLPSDDRLKNIFFIEIPTNDTWTRDYGPLATTSGQGHIIFNDFSFNGWGLKFASDRDNLVTRALFNTGVLKADYKNNLDFVLEGGSVESDGRGTVLTTASCLLSPNRNGCDTPDSANEELKRRLGARKVNWLFNGELVGDDTDGHVDTLARLVPDGDTILYVGCDDVLDEHYTSLSAMEKELMSMTNADGNGYHLIRLPMPDPVIDSDDGSRLPATYANFLIFNGAVFVPLYNQKKNDLLALMTVKAAMPDYEIVGIDCRALVRQHGSLHCATMQLPANTLDEEQLNQYAISRWIK